MAAYVSVRYVLGIFIAVFCILNGVKAINYIKYETPEDCKGVPDEAGYFTYFDISQLQCTRCDQESAYQTTSEDGEWVEGFSPGHALPSAGPRPTVTACTPTVRRMQPSGNITFLTYSRQSNCLRVTYDIYT